MGTVKHKFIFGKDYYLNMIKPIREELGKQLNKKIGVAKKNKDGTYTVTLEYWEMDAIDRITEGVWRQNEVK